MGAKTGRKLLSEELGLTVYEDGGLVNQVCGMLARSPRKYTGKPDSDGSAYGAYGFLACDIVTGSKHANGTTYRKCSARVNVFIGRQMSHVCTGTPFFALLIRPVTGVYLTGRSAAGSEPLEDR